ncbi:proteasome subunit [Cardiosporidium cionae]|uniref:Proteasome subunit beta n=1 Tax=Cardiosporidium cionae TaxID=476202 RepID=A0ABQ7J9I5_9APIC|nr:proteasome subunit [Cardiosporidium cionae]|eukprot:KAF8820621.1 proteasome subunit [Cardiosporidium cionae]
MHPNATLRLPGKFGSSESVFVHTNLENMSSPDTSTPVTTGTTIIAVSFNGGVVFGADTRTSNGPFVSSRATNKFSLLHERIALACAGSSADTAAIEKIVRIQLEMHAQELNSPGGEFTKNGSQLPLRLPTVLSAAKLVQSPLYTYKDNLFASLIVGGWCPKRGGEIYCTPKGGKLVKQSYAADGSGSLFILSYLDQHYHNDLTKEECQDIVRDAVSYAIYRDHLSGGAIRQLTITENSVEEAYITDFPFDP